MHTVSFRRGRIAMTVCDCCGPNAAQARLARGAATTATSGPVDELMVVCMNSRCRRTQRFACAMDFCGRAYHGIPKHLHKSDPWLKEMMPYYRRHCRTRAQPEGNINIPNCIRCCLSATIPDGVKPSPLLQLPHPDPVPRYDKRRQWPMQPIRGTIIPRR